MAELSNLPQVSRQICLDHTYGRCWRMSCLNLHLSKGEQAFIASLVDKCGRRIDHRSPIHEAQSLINSICDKKDCQQCEKVHLKVQVNRFLEVRLLKSVKRILHVRQLDGRQICLRYKNSRCFDIKCKFPHISTRPDLKSNDIIKLTITAGEKFDSAIRKGHLKEDQGSFDWNANENVNIHSNELFTSKITCHRLTPVGEIVKYYSERLKNYVKSEYKANVRWVLGVTIQLGYGAKYLPSLDENAGSLYEDTLPNKLWIDVEDENHLSIGNEECAICFAVFGLHDTVILTCGHKLHSHCIVTMVHTLNDTQYNRQCPLCRHPISKLTIQVKNTDNKWERKTFVMPGPLVRLSGIWVTEDGIITTVRPADLDAREERERIERERQWDEVAAAWNEIDDVDADVFAWQQW